MNLKISFISIVLLVPVQAAPAQGTFVYDQQSADESSLGGGVWDVQSNQPVGQSFTPTLSSVGFIRLYLSDSSFNGLGTTFRVNLLGGSITGVVLSSTSPVSVQDGFHGAVDFLFTTPAPLSPGTPYYFQPIVQSGESFGVYSYNTFNYSRGTAFAFGAPQTAFDLWFREGIIIPEPCGVLLILLTAGICAWHHRKCRKPWQHSGARERT
jgi:hypothetical protein